MTENIFENIPQQIDAEIFDTLVETPDIKIERILSQGQRSPESGWYDQDSNEWVMLLQGAARLSFADRESVELRPGDHLNIPAHTKHCVDWTDPDLATVWLAVHY